MIKPCLSLFALLLLTLVTLAQEEEQLDSPLWGHSSHGAAYDDGPRQRPWKMEGIGSTPFPITSSVPEVQEWFDQGIALLHGFWYYEAERSFRWCLKLDPECAMAHWALAFATRENPERSEEFLIEAIARKGQVTERERAFIEVSEAFMDASDFEDRDEGLGEAMVVLDQLLMDYPDDVEAKSLYWLLEGRMLGEKSELARYGREAVLDDILRRNPDHVGALHYRVHNWDGKEGRYAVDSCMRLGELAPGCGHLLHMPGHVMSGIGLWHEAAIAMDSATRVEKEYMRERHISPEDNWDYVHNLNYLCYIQEQLGLVDQALIGAEQLQLSPAFTKGVFFHITTKIPMKRALLKFERWEELLDEDRIPWNEEEDVEALLALDGRVRAHLGLGNLQEAEELLEKLRDDAAIPDGPPPGLPTGPPGSDIKAMEAFLKLAVKKEIFERLPELEGLLLLAQGEKLEGLALLSEAAELQVDNWENDPPMDATFIYNRLGDEYLELGAPRLAVDCYERTLETIFHDGFALAGLVVAHAQLGETEAAEAAMAKLQVVWSDAELPNRWLAAAEATGIHAEPHLDAPVEQRNYKREVLDKSGPSLWRAPKAPALTALNSEGKEVSLSSYQGQNVLLVFYLGEECVHCIEQLTLAEEHMEKLKELGVVVLAVSRDEVVEIARQQDGFELTLLSDPSFEMARRFHSYDDFEEIELHSTFLINPEGGLHWSRIGGEPFTGFDFIESEFERINRTYDVSKVVEASAGEVSSSK